MTSMKMIGFAVVVILVIAVAGGVITYAYVSQDVLPKLGLGQPGAIVQPVTSSNPGTEGVVNRPLDITLKYPDGSPASGSVNLLSSDGSQTLENDLPIGEAGSVTTTGSYASGTSVVLQFDNGAPGEEQTIFVPFKVPDMGSLDAQTQSDNPIVIYVANTPSYTMTATAGSAAISSGANATLDQTGSITYTLYATQENAGPISSQDPTNNNVQLENVLYVTVTGPSYYKISLSGMDGSFTNGPERIYYKVLTDSSLTQVTKSNGVISQSGTSSVTVNYNIGSFGSEDDAHITATLYIGSNPQYLQNNGVDLPWATPIGGPFAFGITAD
jgi:hypothetical protein